MNLAEEDDHPQPNEIRDIKLDEKKKMNSRRPNMTIRTPNGNSEGEPAQAVSQHKRPREGRFRLQVDRQTKTTHETYDAAEAVGIAIKQGHPVLQVAVYDSLDCVSKIIELPAVAASS